jgi:hypothetical protein
VDEIAEAVGLQTAATLRMHFRLQLITRRGTPVAQPWRFEAFVLFLQGLTLT